MNEVQISKALKRGKCTTNGINPKAIYDFIKDVESRPYGIDSFMLIKDDIVVAEGYYPPYTIDDPHVLYSVSKTITSIALGFAISEKLVSLDDPVSKFFPGYDKHGLNKNVKVRHLVTMTSGKMVGMAQARRDRDWVKIFFDAPFISKPGKMFFYLNDNFFMLSAIITVVSGQSLADYLNSRLFAPLGIKKPVWETDRNGYASGGWGLYMDTESFAKVMLCCSHMGEWNGQQVIPREWLEEATAFQVKTVSRGHIDFTKGYGYGFWQVARPNTYRAYGLHGQCGYVFKDKNTVLILNSGVSMDEYLSDSVNRMCETLWDEPIKEYEEKLSELLSSLEEKDCLPARPRNTSLEMKYNNKVLHTPSTSFASMLHATMTTVMNDPLGKSNDFSLSLDSENNLYLSWREGPYKNRIRLGMDNSYEKTPVTLGGITYTACAKAAWTKEKVLTVLVRMSECCHVRKLDFDFTNEKHIIIRNYSYPDMPTLASHYLIFSGFPLPKPIDNLLIKVIAPAILLIGEQNYYVTKIE